MPKPSPIIMTAKIVIRMFEPDAEQLKYRGLLLRYSGSARSLTYSLKSLRSSKPRVSRKVLSFHSSGTGNGSSDASEMSTTGVFPAISSHPPIVHVM